jgi:hypothetical protein
MTEWTKEKVEVATEKFREQAEKHWEFTKQLMKKTNPSLDDYTINIMHFIYVETMIHGYKHAFDSLIQSGDSK